MKMIRACGGGGGGDRAQIFIFRRQFHRFHFKRMSSKMVATYAFNGVVGVGVVQSKLDSTFCSV